jgi:glucosamine 6-phosphate synthetase-like amidotransferase/phosphosugar isomerase protein
MCGILGYSAAETPTSRLMAGFGRLMEMNMARGTHSSGVAWDGGKRVGFAKAPVRASEFLKGEGYAPFLRARPLEAVGHTRWATQGRPENPDNNHPHVGLDGRLAVVHNGHVGNWAELAAEQGLKMAGQCDSEVLMRLVERGLVAGKDVRASVKFAASQARGSMTFASLLAGEGTLVFRWRNPLAYAVLPWERAVVFSSDADHLLGAFGSSIKTVHVSDGSAIVLKGGKVRKVRVVAAPERERVSLPNLASGGWGLDPAGRWVRDEQGEFGWAGGWGE